MRSNHPARIEYTDHNAFTESDESMIALSMYAKARAMKVMMKPQIWIAYDSWPGNINFPNQESWNQWHESYENWILHYAILSELAQVDLFCIGTELVQATLQNPSRWRQTVQRIRQIYHGPLVYAANYGKEFEQLTFWDSLDYMGLDNYYPIRRSADADPAG